MNKGMGFNEWKKNRQSVSTSQSQPSPAQPVGSFGVSPESGFDAWKKRKQAGLVQPVDYSYLFKDSENGATQTKPVDQVEHEEKLGFFGKAKQSIAGGILDTAEMFGRAGRSLPGGDAAGSEGQGITSKVIKWAQERAPKQDYLNDSGTIEKAVQGGIRAATTSLASALPGAAAGAAVGSVVPIAGTAIGAVVGGALSGGTLFGASAFDKAKEDVKGKIQNGEMTDKQANEHAAIIAAIEGGGEGVANLLEGMTFGGAKIVTTPAKNFLKEGVKSLFKDSLKDAGKRTLKTGAFEVGSEVVQSGAEAEENRRIGVGDQRFTDAALSAFGPALVSSFIFSGIGEAGLKLSRRNAEKTLSSGDADKESRLSIANEVYDQIKESHPDIAETWKTSSSTAIENGESIPLDASITEPQTAQQDLQPYDFSADFAPQESMQAQQSPAEGDIIPAAEIPKSSPNKVTALFDAIDSQDDTKIAETMRDMSKLNLEDARKVLENVKENSEENALSADDLLKIEDHLEKIDLFLGEKHTAIEEKARQIVSGGVTEEEITNLHEEDVPQAIKVVERTMEVLDQKKSDLLAKKTVAADKQAKKQIQREIDAIDESRHAVNNGLKTVKSALKNKKAPAKKKASINTVEDVDKAIAKRIEKFRKESGTVISGDMAEGVGVRQRVVSDATGDVNFVAKDFKKSTAKFDMKKRADESKKYSKEILYENDPEFRALVDKRDELLEKKLNEATTEIDVQSVFDELEAEVTALTNNMKFYAGEQETTRKTQETSGAGKKEAGAAQEKTVKEEEITDDSVVRLFEFSSENEKTETLRALNTYNGYIRKGFSKEEAFIKIDTLYGAKFGYNVQDIVKKKEDMVNDSMDNGIARVSEIKAGDSNFYSEKDASKRSFNDLLTSPIKLKYKKDGYFSFPKEKISSPADIAFAFKELKNEAVEKFYVVGTKDDVPVSIECISMGTINQSLVDPFETVDILLRKGANGAYFIHNHPSGDVTPSSEDINLTQRLKQGYSSFDIEFKGHIIIDTTKFGLIDQDIKGSKEFQMTGVKNPVKYDAYKKYVQWIGKKPTDFRMDNLVDVASVIKGMNIDSENSSLIIFVNNGGYILSVQSVPKNDVNLKSITTLATSMRSKWVFVANHNLDNAKLRTLKRNLQLDANITLNDAINMTEDDTFISAMSTGVFEEPSEYSVSAKTNRDDLSIFSDAKTKNELSDEIETRIGYLDAENIDEFIAAESLRAILGRIGSFSLSDAKSKSEEIIQGVLAKRGEEMAKTIKKEKKTYQLSSIAEKSRSFDEFSFNLKKSGYDTQKEFGSKSAAEDFYNRSASTQRKEIGNPNNKESTQLNEEARKYKSAEEFFLRVPRATRMLLYDINVKSRGQFEEFWKKATKGIDKTLVIEDLNPTGGLYVDYNPKARMTAKLGKNITTLDKTSGESPDTIVTIYRGAPKNQKRINPGDFVTTNYELAKSYAGDGVVLSKDVKMSDVLDDKTEPLGEEYLYRPKKAGKRDISETLKSISDQNIQTFIGKDFIEREIKILKENMDPFLAKKLVMDIVTELVEGKGNQKLYAGGQYSKYFGIAQISQSQDVDSLHEAVIHEPGHFAWMFLSNEEKSSIIREIEGKSLQERRNVFGKSVQGGWRYDRYVREYQGKEDRLMEEMAVIMASREAMYNLKQTGSMYSRSKGITKMQMIVNKFAMLYNRVAGLLSRKFNVKIPLFKGLGMDIMREIYNNKSTFFEGRMQRFEELSKEEKESMDKKTMKTLLDSSGNPISLGNIYKKTFERMGDIKEPPKEDASEKEKKEPRSVMAIRLNEVLPEGSKIEELYDVKHIKEESLKAGKKIEKDKEAALREAFDNNASVTDRNMLLGEFGEIARRDGDMETLNSLLTTRRKNVTESAQALALEKAFVVARPEEKYMQDVIQARLAKIRVGKSDLANAVKEIRQTLEKKAKQIAKKTKISLKIEKAQALFDSLIC